MRKYLKPVRLWMQQPRISRHWPYWSMLALVLLILFPLYRRGFILHYDMVFATHYDIGWRSMREGTILWQALPVRAVLGVASTVLPGDIVQKLLLSGILFGGLVVFYRSALVRSRAARLLAAVMYMCNPFTYDRLMAGHWSFLLGYILTPLFASALYRLYKAPSWAALRWPLAWWTLMAWANAHHMVIGGMVWVGVTLAMARKRRVVVYGVLCGVGVMLLNLWWLVPLLLAPPAYVQFGVAHLQAFHTKTDMQYGIWLNMLSLHGFWYDTGWRHVKDFFGWWPWLTLVWLLPVWTGLGVVLDTVRKRRFMVGLSVAAVAGLVFAGGQAAPFSALNTWVFQHIPGMSGLREPQKLLALVTLAYAYAAGFGWQWLLQGLRQEQRRINRLGLKILVVGAGLAVLAMVRPFAWGMAGQLHTVQYPHSWYVAQTYLTQQRPGRVLVLPWSIYTDQTLQKSVTANPAAAFFGERAVVSTRMLVPGVPDTENQCGQMVSKALARENGAELVAAAKACGADHLLVTEHFQQNESDTYSWLYGLPATRMLDRPELLFFRLDTKE